MIFFSLYFVFSAEEEEDLVPAGEGGDPQPEDGEATTQEKGDESQDAKVTVKVDLEAGQWEYTVR